MDAIDHDKKRESIAVQATNSDEKVGKRVEKVALDTHDMKTAKYVARKLADKGIIQIDRYSSNCTMIGQVSPKLIYRGKYTWEVPEDVVRSELLTLQPAVDKRDQNYVDEREEIKLEEERECVVGDVEVAKAEETGVRRIDLDPKLKASIDT